MDVERSVSSKVEIKVHGDLQVNFDIIYFNFEAWIFNV